MSQHFQVRASSPLGRMSMSTGFPNLQCHKQCVALGTAFLQRRFAATDSSWALATPRTDHQQSSELPHTSSHETIDCSERHSRVEESFPQHGDEQFRLVHLSLSCKILELPGVGRDTSLAAPDRLACCHASFTYGLANPCSRIRP